MGRPGEAGVLGRCGGDGVGSGVEEDELVAVAVPVTLVTMGSGLLNAVNVVFPNCNQIFCLRHIYANFQTAGFRGEDLKKYMFNASYAYNEHKFNIAMMDLRAEMNNLSEVFNKYILDVRRKPIRTMCDGIKDKQRVRWHRNRESGRTTRWRITPHYSENLDIEKERAKYHKPIQAGVNLWQVTSGQQTHAVNLKLHTCGCRKGNLTGIPCNHVISAINKAKRFPEDFVNTFFKKEFYLAAYEPMTFPVPGEHYWTRTTGSDIEPPEFKVKRGRKKEKRIKGKFEVQKPKDSSRMGTITCGNCGLQGHRLLQHHHSQEMMLAHEELGEVMAQEEMGEVLAHEELAEELGEEQLGEEELAEEELAEVLHRRSSERRSWQRCWHKRSWQRCSKAIHCP
ncbi:hypothetical protein D1007_32991 [Hordeum vulgare]|nr:hypothetical protein D1007_32991 [Hordeum vulgare]